MGVVDQPVDLIDPKRLRAFIEERGREVRREYGPKYTARDLLTLANLTYRQLNDWDSKGVLPAQPKRGRGWRKFTVKEVFAVMVCAEIREKFGLPLERLRWLKGRMLLGRYEIYRASRAIMESAGFPTYLLSDLSSFMVMGGTVSFARTFQEGGIVGKAFNSSVLLYLNPLVNRLLAYEEGGEPIPDHGRGYSHPSWNHGIIRTPLEREVLDKLREGEVREVVVTLSDGREIKVRPPSGKEGGK